MPPTPPMGNFRYGRQTSVSFNGFYAMTHSSGQRCRPCVISALVPSCQSSSHDTASYLATKKIKNLQTAPIVSSVSLPVRYCICRSTSDEGRMVSCDRCDEWFHLECLKLKRLPTAKTWYCPECRKKGKEEKNKPKNTSRGIICCPCKTVPNKC